MLVLERAGRVEELVGVLPQLHERALVLCRPLDSALVLGSTQPESQVDPDALRRARLGLARRRSGGGAVLVEPGRQLWADIYLPTSDPLFERDVTLGAALLGEILKEALVGCDLPADELVVHRGALVVAPHSERLCFLGLGPGEVLFSKRKLLGLSQRRDRAGGWFFIMTPLEVDPALEASLFRLETPERVALEAALKERVGVLPPNAPLEEQLAAALERH